MPASTGPPPGPTGGPRSRSGSTPSSPAGSTGRRTSHDLPPVPASFLAALHACGRSAARDPARFALNRIQVRGTAGQVVGTDGRAALLWGGFRFPFRDDVLVPAIPAFGSKELAGEGDVRVGLADGHLVVAVGP